MQFYNYIKVYCITHIICNYPIDSGENFWLDAYTIVVLQILTLCSCRHQRREYVELNLLEIDLKKRMRALFKYEYSR